VSAFMLRGDSGDGAGSPPSFHFSVTSTSTS
jgi:hypothetical protein